MVCTIMIMKKHFKVIECSEDIIHVAEWAGDLSNGDKNYCYHRNYVAIDMHFL